MLPLRATFRQIPCLLLPCGKWHRDGRCQSGSGFASKLRPRLFVKILGRCPCTPRAEAGPGQATVRACTQRHTRWRLPRPATPAPPSAGPGAPQGGDISSRIFTMQCCTLLLYAELIIYRLHYYFSDRTHGATALQHHFPLPFRKTLPSFSLIDVQASYILYYFWFSCWRALSWPCHHF